MECMLTVKYLPGRRLRLTNVLEYRGFVLENGVEIPTTTKRSNWWLYTVTFAADYLDFDGPVWALWICCRDSDVDEYYLIMETRRFLTALGPALGMKVPDKATYNICQRTDCSYVPPSWTTKAEAWASSIAWFISNCQPAWANQPTIEDPVVQGYFWHEQAFLHEWCLARHTSTGHRRFLVFG